MLNPPRGQQTQAGTGGNWPFLAAQGATNDLDAKDEDQDGDTERSRSLPRGGQAGHDVVKVSIGHGRGCRSNNTHGRDDFLHTTHFWFPGRTCFIPGAPGTAYDQASGPRRPHHGARPTFEG